MRRLKDGGRGIILQEVPPAIPSVKAPRTDRSGPTAGIIPGHARFQLFRHKQEFRHHLNEETQSDYIKDPRAKIPNTKMIFPGIKNEKEAGDLWAYLKQYGPDGQKK